MNTKQWIKICSTSLQFVIHTTMQLFLQWFNHGLFKVTKQMDTVFYLNLIGSYTPVVAGRNTWCSHRICLVDEEGLALTQSAQGGERRMEVVTRTAFSVHRMVESLGLGFLWRLFCSQREFCYQQSVERKSVCDWKIRWYITKINWHITLQTAAGKGMMPVTHLAD